MLTMGSKFRKITDKEMNELLEVMNEYFDYQEQPKVGIFFYSPKYDVLFGVIQIDIDLLLKSEPTKNILTCRNIHKHVWKSNHDKYQHIKCGYEREKELYSESYKGSLRGRVVYLKDKDEYGIYVGSWINDYPNAIDTIKEEFNLTNPDLNIHTYEALKGEVERTYID